MTTTPPSLPDERRHDLDALRGFAMLLGIVLHATLAYTGPNWVVQDRSESFLLTCVWAFIHGWRMELFFVLAGYFTAMVLCREGPVGMLKRRLRRLVVPFLLGVAVVIPLTYGASEFAKRRAEFRKIPAVQLNEPIHDAVRDNDQAILKKVAPDDPEVGNAQYLAAALGQTRALQTLLKRTNDRPAETMLASLHGENALHAAARFGQTEAAQIILQAAHGHAWETELLATKNEADLTAADLAAVEERETRQLARRLGVTINDDWNVGRKQVLQLLAKDGGIGALRWTAFLHKPLLNHLWFMWVLILITLPFGLWAWANHRWDLPGLPRWMLAEWTRLLWLLPTTTLLFWWSTANFGFGIVGEMSIAERPAAIVTYGFFFAFGAALRLRGNEPAKLPWLAWIQLPALVFLVLPLAFALGLWGNPIAHFLSCALQAWFAWGMTFTLLDLFAAHCAKPIPVVRTLADASLWIYLMHLPLVIVLQAWMATWKLWPIVKCGLVCAITFSVLLLVNHFLVRRSWVGLLVNGRRESEKDRG